MCDRCLYLIAKADDDDFLDSLDLTHAERELLEKLYKEGEGAIADLLELQGKALDEAIQELSEELATDPDELWKVIVQIQGGDYFQEKFEQAVYDAFIPLFHLAGESETVGINEKAKWDTKNKEASKFSRKLVKLVPSMNETSANHLLRSFQQAIEHGKTPAERAALVKEVSKKAAEGEEGPFSMQRAVTISRTLSTAAANGGKLEGWKQSGKVKGKKWRSANNTRTRPSHRRANGQVRAIDEPFQIGKSKLMYPGDSSGSGEETINCRCVMQSLFYDPSPEYKITSSITKEDLEQAVMEPHGKRGTAVGRAFQKHSVRPKTAFTGEITGNPQKNTDQGEAFIKALLDDSDKTISTRKHPAYGDILDVRMLNRQGARWSGDGQTFIGFLEP